MKTRVSLKYFVTDCRLYLLALVSGERLVCYFDCVMCTYILTKNTCEILTNETPIGIKDMMLKLTSVIWICQDNSR